MGTMCNENDVVDEGILILADLDWLWSATSSGPTTVLCSR
jgi:hypothetical protein